MEVATSKDKGGGTVRRRVRRVIDGAIGTGVEIRAEKAIMAIAIETPAGIGTVIAIVIGTGTEIGVGAMPTMRRKWNIPTENANTEGMISGEENGGLATRITTPSRNKIRLLSASLALQAHRRHRRRLLIQPSRNIISSIPSTINNTTISIISRHFHRLQRISNIRAHHLHRLDQPRRCYTSHCLRILARRPCLHLVLHRDHRLRCHHRLSRHRLRHSIILPPLVEDIKGSRFGDEAKGQEEKEREVGCRFWRGPSSHICRSYCCARMVCSTAEQGAILHSTVYALWFPTVQRLTRTLSMHVPMQRPACLSRMRLS